MYTRCIPINGTYMETKIKELLEQLEKIQNEINNLHSDNKNDDYNEGVELAYKDIGAAILELDFILGNFS